MNIIKLKLEIKNFVIYENSRGKKNYSIKEE
jgi:hypothetical protein